MILLDRRIVGSMLPHRDSAGHKGTFGTVYCLCGSDDMFGAAILSASAVLRSGAGLCIVGGSGEMCRRVISARPETVAHITDGLSVFEIAEKINTCTTVVIGSGLGVQNRVLVRELIPHIKIPMVIDADGIRALSHDFDWNCIKVPFAITPHPGEMGDLCGSTSYEINQNREKYAVTTAERIGGIVLLKGSGTLITDGETIYYNPTGNDGMATAGSGDVLGGIIGGLAAQGCDVLTAAATGAYLHGLAGDLASEEMTKYSLIASDLIKYLPKAINEICK